MVEPVEAQENAERPTHWHERDVIADYLLTHVGGDEAQPWQAGHNYAMREAARLVREQCHLLDLGRRMDCPDCGRPGPHVGQPTSTGWIECNPAAEDEPDDDGYHGCGASWPLDQRNLFPGLECRYDD